MIAKTLSFFLLMNMFHISLQSEDWSMTVTTNMSGTTLKTLEEAKASLSGMSSCQKKLESSNNNQANQEQTLSEAITRIQDQIRTNKLLLCSAGMQQHVIFPATGSNIQNEQITSSSHYRNLEAFAPYYGRLFGRPRHFWAAGTNDEHQWIQVDLKEDKTIYGVTTQGRVRDSGEWVSSYSVEFKPANRNYLTPVIDDSGEIMIFQGNTDNSSPVTNDFPHGITGRVFRIKVLTWRTHISLRFDLLTC